MRVVRWMTHKFWLLRHGDAEIKRLRGDLAYSSEVQYHKFRRMGLLK